MLNRYQDSVMTEKSVNNTLSMLNQISADNRSIDLEDRFREYHDYNLNIIVELITRMDTLK